MQLCTGLRKYKCSVVPADEVLIEEVTALLLLLSNIALTLTAHSLPGARREMLVVLIAPSTTFVVCVDGVPHKCVQLMETV